MGLALAWCEFLGLAALVSLADPAGGAEQAWSPPSCEQHDAVASAQLAALVRCGSGAVSLPTANSAQVPRTPSSSRSPRDWRAMPEPVTRSRTVRDTSTSPGPDSALTRAAM
jgi:hypothetical protein